MSYKPLTRRHFLRLSGGGAIGAVALEALGTAAGILGTPSSSYADLVTDDKILTLFGDAYNILVREKGNKFEYEDYKIDVNGDGKPDKISFKLAPGEFVTKEDNSGIVEGPRFEMQIELGDGWIRKIYGIIGSNGKPSICKSVELGEKGANAGTYLDVWLKHHKSA